MFAEEIPTRIIAQLALGVACITLAFVILGSSLASSCGEGFNLATPYGCLNTRRTVTKPQPSTFITMVALSILTPGLSYAAFAIKEFYYLYQARLHAQLARVTARSEPEPAPAPVQEKQSSEAGVDGERAKDT
jgi:hypothetical protein